MKRSFSTLKYIFSQQNKSNQTYLSNIIKGSGLGFSKNAVFEKIENKQKSRRVSFKIDIKSLK